MAKFEFRIERLEDRVVCKSEVYEEFNEAKLAFWASDGKEARAKSAALTEDFAASLMKYASDLRSGV